MILLIVGAETLKNVVGGFHREDRPSHTETQPSEIAMPQPLDHIRQPLVPRSAPPRPYSQAAEGQIDVVEYHEKIALRILDGQEAEGLTNRPARRVHVRLRLENADVQRFSAGKAQRSASEESV